MSERYDVLSKKPLAHWTKEDLQDYTEIIAVGIGNAAEGNDFLDSTLTDLLVLTRVIPILERLEALKREQTLREDLRACIEEVAEDHVEFQFDEFAKRNKEEINNIQNKIESLNVRMDRFGGE